MAILEIEKYKYERVLSIQVCRPLKLFYDRLPHTGSQTSREVLIFLDL